MSEADGHHAACYHSETKVAPLRTAVVQIFGNDGGADQRTLPAPS
jgi:hypothetical protein